MYAFYVVRGYTLEYLANVSYVEKCFLRHAQENFYKQEAQKYNTLFGGGK